MKRRGTLAPVVRTAVGRTFRIGRMFEEAARRCPDTSVVLDEPLSVTGSGRTEYTYAELAEVVDDLAARLRQAGVKPGDYVPVHKGANFDLPLLACAAARIGAVPVMLSPALSPATVLILLDRLKAPWIVMDAEKLGVIAAEAPELNADVLLTEAVAEVPADTRVIHLSTLTGGPRPAPVDLPPDHPTLITHSSGTTGVPKLMVHSSRTLAHRLLPQQLLAWPVRRREKVLLAMSFVHSRFFNSLGVFLFYGNPVVVIGPARLEKVREILVRTRPTVAETHPNNFVLWEDFADDPDRPLSSIGYYSSTFDAIHPGTVKRLLASSSHRRPVLLQLFGQSETGPLTGWLNTLPSVDRVDGRCIGVRLPGFTRIRVVDDSGHPVPPGTIGRLEVRTRGRIQTYLAEEGRFRSQLNKGWWYVGDMGWKDRKGRTYLADREVDKINAIDSNLSVEDVLMERLPEIAELVIVPSQEGLPTPLLATRDDRPLDRRRWAAAVAELPDLDAPIQWRFADFPRTSTWKIRRLEIRELLRTGTGPTPVPEE